MVSWGSSDHDAMSYIRYTKEPKAPAKTIRRRSYKGFDKEKYLHDISQIDFSDVYGCLDVDIAAELLTQKIVDVLNVHAPWIVFQQRKHYVPWVTPETVEQMPIRDSLKQKAISLVKVEGNQAS